MDTLGWKMNDHQLKKAMLEIDTSGDGTISYAEFEVQVQHCPTCWYECLQEYFRK